MAKFKVGEYVRHKSKDGILDLTSIGIIIGKSEDGYKIRWTLENGSKANLTYPSHHLSLDNTLQNQSKIKKLLKVKK